MGTTTGTGEAQYMQQQSQIYVFSTTLANKGADAVLRGDYISIIAYHQAQPGTKKYLEVVFIILFNYFNNANILYMRACRFIFVSCNTYINTRVRRGKEKMRKNE